MPELVSTEVAETAVAAETVETTETAETAATETVETAETTETAEAAEVGELEAEAEVDGEGQPIFTPEQQTIFNQRLGKEIGKRKAVEEKLAAAEAKVAEGAGQIDPNTLAAAGAVKLHPRYVGPDELQIIREANTLEARQQVLAGDAWEEGIASEDPKTTLTARQVRLEFAENARRLAAISGKANAAYDAALKTQLEDMEEGAKYRAMREKARAAAVKKTTTAQPRSAVVVRPGAAPARERPVAGPSEERFKKAGATAAAAVKELEHMVAV